MSVTFNSRRDQSAVSGDVAIIGMACTFPSARDVNQFWQNIVNRVDAIADVSPERWDPEVFYDPDPEAEDRVYCKRGGWLPDSFAFNPLKYGTMPRTVEGGEPDQFLVLRTIHEAMDDAGYLERRLDGLRTAFILGRGNYLGAGLWSLVQRGIITEQTLEVIKGLHPEYSPEQLREMKATLRAKLPKFNAETAPGLIPNITTGRAANRLDLMGANFTVDAACASSLIATELGVRNLLSGKDDLVLVGGVHICSDVPFLQVFDAMKALSQTSTIRPFDRDCDGTLAGEGVGILVLKRLEDAERDRDRIYAVVKGVGSSSDGKAKSVTAPRVEGEELALRRAYEMSGVAPETVGLIEAHGTGTPVGDAAEVEALRRVFKPRNGGPPGCALGSVKSMIGHTMPAAGAAGLIKTALALYHRVLPPTLNCREPVAAIAEAASPVYVNTETRPWINGGNPGPRRAGVNAFGFGGVNAHVVLEEYSGPQAGKLTGAAGDEQSTLIREWETELFVVEGDTRERLAAEVARLQAYAAAADRVAPRDLAFTLNRSLGGGRRVAVVASTLPDLAKKLAHVAGRLQDPRCKQIKDGQGIYYFEESPLRDGKLALLFPGEGSQYVNMLADLCVHFPQVRKCFDAADRAARGPGRYPPSADIFPPPFFSEDEARAAEARLWKIERATEAVLTADGAIYMLLKQFGLKADMIAGHSAGEWVAMAASGILDIDEFVSSMTRLDAMYRKLADDTTIPSMAMLAVGAGREKVERLLAETNRSVYIANDNCPHQVVVVVEPGEAEAVTKHLQSRGVFVEKLPYDRGYHTPVFTYICEPLRKYFSSLRIRQPHTAVYSCTTARPFPAGPAEILDLVTDTFARPLLFRDMIEAMYEAGARVFVEAGPRGGLTAFVDDILRGRPHVAIATDRPRKSGVTALNHALGMLAALNVELDLSLLYNRRSPRLLTLDAAADKAEDEDTAPGTLQVSICYPKLVIAGPPRSAPPPGAAKVMSEVTRTKPEESTTAARPRVEPEVRQPISDRRGAQGGQASHADNRTVPADPGAFVPEKVGKSNGALSSFPTKVLDEHFQLMEQFLQTQEEVMQAYLGRPAMPEIESVPVITPAQVGDRLAENGAGKDQFRLEARQLNAPADVSSWDRSQPDEPTTNERAAPDSTQTTRLQDVLLGIVSEKTGYPLEMLGLDLDMEADLGIDSIKRIEILGALQQAVQGSSARTGDADMEEVAKLKTLRQIIHFLERTGGSATSDNTALAGGSAIPGAQALTFSGEVMSYTPGKEAVVHYPLDLDEDLFLNDHCFDSPASESDHERSRLSFVPMTVSVEIMAEVATLLMPGLKVVGVREVQALKWIDVERDGPKVVLAITARRTSSDSVRAEIRRYLVEGTPGPAASESLAEAVIVFAEAFPSAPLVEESELKKARPPACTAAEMYEERRMFHGPRFQGVASLDRIGENGLLAQLEVLPTNGLFKSNPSPKFQIDPFLLDAAGQLVGYWPVEYLSEGFVLFPIRIRELVLYRENLEPGRRARCQLRIRDVTQRQLRADIDVIGPEGELWMRVVGWEDWRFYWAKNFNDFWRFPDKGVITEPIEITKPAGCPEVECRRITAFGEMAGGMWENLGAHLVLSRRELAQYRAMSNPLQRSEWFFGRAAAKDAARVWVKRHYGRDLYPTDMEITPDEHGRPNVSHRWLNQSGIGLQISIAHKGAVAVAAAARCDVGIDIERIEPRDAGFEALAFGESERQILGGRSGAGRDEWLTRAWCAKEAAGKAIGRGLDGNPRSMVIRGVHPNEQEIVVSPKASVPPGAGEEFVVRSVRDGDLIIALAIREGNRDARA